MQTWHTEPRRRRHLVAEALAAHDRIPAWLVVLGTSLLLTAAIVSSRQPLPEISTSVSLTVKPGQTLWGIAREHPVPGLSTAQTVDLICALNGLDRTTITPGDVLHVPVPEPSGSGLAMR